MTSSLGGGGGSIAPSIGKHAGNASMKVSRNGLSIRSAAQNTERDLPTPQIANTRATKLAKRLPQRTTNVTCAVM
jgi:hypothetical protein